MLYWSTVLNFLMQNYFVDSHTTCIIWHPKFDLHLDTPPLNNTTYVAILNIWKPTLQSSFENDVYDFTTKDTEFEVRGIAASVDMLIKKLIVAIEHTHCETFVAFQEDIPVFAKAFYLASSFAIWRSTRNRFIFAYSKDLTSQKVTYFDEYLFKGQPNLLIVEALTLDASVFQLRTNQFVGSRYSNRTAEEDFYLLNTYDALKKRLMQGTSLYVPKLDNLEGREMVIGIFDYRPFMVVDYNKYPRVYDRSSNKSQDFLLIDGTEVRVMMLYCELKNCCVQADTTETDWGYVYVNATGIGLFGMAMERQIDYAIGGLYLWYLAYMSLDITHFLGRSGITCLVPAPTQLFSWTLPLRPFQQTLWLSVLACLLLEICALWLTQHYGQVEKKVSWQSSLRFGYVSSLKLFLNQSTNYSITATAVRIVLLSCYMIDIILTSIYSGGLATILTLPTLGEAADSRQRLYTHKLVWTGTAEAWTIGIDGEMEDPVTVGLLKQFEVHSATEITTLSEIANMGFIVERMSYGHIGNSELISTAGLERLKLMVDDIYFAYAVAYVPRLWPFLDDFNNFLLAWHSSGFNKYWEWKIAADYMDANTQNRIVASQHPNLDIGPVKLGMDNFMGLILLWLLGMILSVLAFITELAIGRVSLSASDDRN